MSLTVAASDNLDLHDFRILLLNFRTGRLWGIVSSNCVSQGVTSLHLAVYKYEETRSLDMIKFLLAHGANVSLKAAVLPSAHKISIIRHAQAGHLGTPIETKKVVLDQKTPLQVALELKSTLYLRGTFDACFNLDHLSFCSPFDYVRSCYVNPSLFGS